MKRLLLVALILITSACSSHIQRSSGRAFIESAPNGVARVIDDDIAAVAAVEPDLHFPARIGIARIVNGALTIPPTEELALFASVAERNAQYGEFIPVSPLILSMVTGSPTQVSARYASGNARKIIQDIRLASARQHLDYVIIYEVGARSRAGDTPFALADVTLIGGILLPTRQVQVSGVGAALFVDVRNGYPYGTAQVSADLSGFARTFATNRRSETLRAEATLKVAQALVPEVENMLTELGNP